MSNTWFCSDLHIGHRLVAGIRGFWDEDNVIDTADGPECLPDTAAHDEWLANLWDSTVQPKDTVWVLGDISINGKEAALDWFSERPGRKMLISGNHDPVHPMSSRASKLMGRWLEVFDYISPFAQLKYQKKMFLMSHFPYASHGDGLDREGSRYNEFRLPDVGLPLLHGHTHGQETAHGNMLHVGIDAWKKLVPVSEVYKWLDSLDTAP